jgi:hypothetical protein
LSVQLPVCGFGVPCRASPPLSEIHAAPPPTPAVLPMSSPALQAHLPAGVAEQYEVARRPQQALSPHLGRASLGTFDMRCQQQQQQQQQQQPRPQFHHHHHHLQQQQQQQTPQPFDPLPPYYELAPRRDRGHVRSHSLPTAAPNPSNPAGVAGMRPLHLPSPFACPQTPSSSSMSTNFSMMRGGGGGDDTSMHVHHFHHHFGGGGGSSSSIGVGTPRPALPMPTQTAAPAAPGPGGHLGHDGRPNITVPISQVLNFLYLGSRREASDKAQLKSLSVGFVLNMTADVPNYFPDAFQYQQVPILVRPPGEQRNSFFFLCARTETPVVTFSPSILIIL